MALHLPGGAFAGSAKDIWELNCGDESARILSAVLREVVGRSFHFSWSVAVGWEQTPPSHLNSITIKPHKYWVFLRGLCEILWLQLMQYKKSGFYFLYFQVRLNIIQSIRVLI